MTGVNLMELTTCVVERPIRIYCFNGVEVEAEHFWEALIEIRDAPASFGVYGTNRLDPSLAGKLVAAKLIRHARPDGNRYLPTRFFDDFYQAAVALTKGISADEEPAYIWRTE